MRLSPLRSKSLCNSFIGFTSVPLSIFPRRHFPYTMFPPVNFISWNKKRQTKQPKPCFLCFTVSELIRLDSLRTLANIFLHNCFRLLKCYALTIFTRQIPKLFTKFNPFNSERAIPVPAIPAKSGISARWMIDYQIPLHKSYRLARVNLQVVSKHTAWNKVTTPRIMTALFKFCADNSALFTVYKYIHNAILRQNKSRIISVSLQFSRGTK